MLISSCTQPGGQIGKWFGNWRSEEITVDGEEMPSDTYNPIMLAFQSSLFSMWSPGMSTLYGEWKDARGSIILQADPEAEPGSHFPDAMGFEDATTVELVILEINSKHLRLEWTSPRGEVWTYSFKKVY